MARPKIRLPLVLALAWLLASVVLTILMAPHLGGRGLLWLGVQDVLCLIGCGWEIQATWRRARQ